MEIGVTRMQVRVPRKQIGDTLAQSRAMHASSECPNIWVPMFGVQTSKNRVLSVYLCVQIEKWSICMFICVISQRNHDFTED